LAGCPGDCYSVSCSTKWKTKWLWQQTDNRMAWWSPLHMDTEVMTTGIEWNLCVKEEWQHDKSKETFILFIIIHLTSVRLRANARFKLSVKSFRCFCCDK
jgi:hypothetical protein